MEICEDLSIYPEGGIIPITLHNIQTGRYFACMDGRILDWNGNYITPHLGNTGYLRVTLNLNEYKNNRRVMKKFSVHRLIAECFCYNDDPILKNQVDHIDGNKLHNWPTNLQWVTQSQNIINAYDTNLCSTKGESCHLHNPIYTDELVHEMCSCLERGLTYREIIMELNLCDLNDRETYQRYRKYLKNLKSRRCRRDITSLYKY